MNVIFWMLLVFSGLAFYSGLPFVFGIGDSLITIPVPQNYFVGWLLIGLACVWLVPGFLVARVDRWIKKRMHASVIGRANQRSDNG